MGPLIAFESLSRRSLVNPARVAESVVASMREPLLDKSRISRLDFCSSKPSQSNSSPCSSIWQRAHDRALRKPGRFCRMRAAILLVIAMDILVKNTYRYPRHQ